MIRIIEINGNTTDLINHQSPPTYKQLAKIIGCDFPEKVNVFYEGEYEQMFVDETGALKPDRQINQAATNIYHNNCRVHDPAILDESIKIYGVAILLTGKSKVK